MILIIDNGDGNFAVNYHPERLGKTDEELREIGVLMESIPEPEVIEGKDAVMRFDGANIYYEYVDIPLTIEEQILELKKQQVATDKLMADSNMSQQQLIELLLITGVL